jgi:signal transduction histidine kinase
MARKRHDRRSPDRTKTDKSLREERANTDDAIKGDRTASERVAEGVIDKARAIADAAVKAERKKTDTEARRPARPSKKGAVAGQRAKADRSVRGERGSADDALRSDLEDRADALDALLVHERAATDAYLLTERVRSDKDVAHRDDFLGMVAHDVRNLLNGVVLNLELLAPSAAGEPDAQRSAATSRIRRDVARMARLIGDLVDVTSIDAGKLAMAPVEGDAAALLAEATDAFQPAARQRGVSLAAEIPAGTLRAVFDHDRILQVFANLISNAIKFTPPGGRITIGVEGTRTLLRFRVSDTGGGIPARMLESIFERFWQVGKNDNRGLGLGLYISRCIVESHGGRIWAESKVGKGSQFSFTIPVKRSRPRRSTARIAGGDDKARLRRRPTARAVRGRR